MKILGWILLGVVVFCSFCFTMAYFGLGTPQPEDYRRYKLASGKIIECASKGESYCGSYFFRCRDGKEYNCQTNVEPQ